jgi:hypothetical protein
MGLQKNFVDESGIGGGMGLRADYSLNQQFAQHYIRPESQG